MRRIAAAVLACLLLGAGSPASGAVPGAAPPREAGSGPVLSGTRAPGGAVAAKRKKARPVLYLTFDDGPGPYTGRLLRALRKNKAKATFFLVGSRAAGQRKLVRRIARRGHAIGNHTYWHPFLTRASTARIHAELGRTRRAIGRAQGPCMRPPYGDIDARVRSVARQHGLTPVLWTYDTYDWRRPGVDVLVSRFRRATRPGAIILAHDIHPGTVAAVERMLPRWRAMGYRLRPLPACRAR